jgi:twitching motility protein PilT
MANDTQEIEKLFRSMAKTNASDLHLKVGSPPVLRINQRLQNLKYDTLTEQKIWDLAEPLMSDRDKDRFERTNNAEFAHSIAGVGRYRVTMLRQRGTITVVVRRVSYDIPDFDKLHLPEGLRQCARFEQGLILVAGPTGSGKSTTLAALLDEINHRRRCHILTVEDPIEYLYRDDQALVNQREVGIDVESFQAGLVYGLRADPDVILIGELRDSDTFETALRASETGHLVFGTIHVSSAAQSIGRLLDLFPEQRHTQIRHLLSFNLRAVIVQMLLRGAREDAPLVPAAEVMIVNAPIKKLILEGEDNKISDVISGGRTEGMQNMTQSLYQLVRRGLVAEQTAMESAPNPEQLKMMLSGIVVHGSEGGILRARGAVGGRPPV